MTDWITHELGPEDQEPDDFDPDDEEDDIPEDPYGDFSDEPVFRILPIGGPT